MAAVRYAVLCALWLLSACSAPPRPTPLTDQLLAAAREWGDREFEEPAVRAQLAAVADDVQRAATASPRSVALGATVFERWHFVREVDEHALRYSLLPEVVRTRRGNCVGLGTLYLAVGERLGWDLRGVMVPGHFFVRIQASGLSQNLELLRRGQGMPDAWYVQRFPIPGPGAREYARPLSASEVVGVVEYNAGDDRKQRGELDEAARAYDRARRHFPDFAEAHASRGALAHLVGRLDEALEAYRLAQRANAALPGVARNIALLEAERAAGATRREDTPNVVLER